MVRFKSFEDFHKFLKEYAWCSCLNCVGYDYAKTDEICKQFICFKTLSPVRFDLLHLCAEWESKDGKLLSDFGDKSQWKFSDNVAEKIDKLTEASFEEIKEIVESEGK